MRTRCFLNHDPPPPTEPLHAAFVHHRRVGVCQCYLETWTRTWETAKEAEEKAKAKVEAEEKAKKEAEEKAKKVLEEQ